MKKSLILTCIAVLAISSCIRDEVKEVNRGQAIDFRAATQTKGKVVYGTSSLGNFYATAMEEDWQPYFKDVVFSLVGDYFTSSPAYYWPGDGRTLDFYAYSPSLDKLGNNAEITLNSEGQKITGITPNADIRQQVDFLSGLVTDKTEENSQSGIEINFSHNMASIMVTAATNLSDYEYIIAGVRIDNAVSSGDFDITNETWTPGTEKTNYELTYTDSPITLVPNSSDVPLMGYYTDFDGDDEEHYAMIVPQAFNDAEGTDPLVTLSVYLQINFTNADGTKTRIFPENGSEYGWVSTPFPSYTKDSQTMNEWLPGTKYEYSISFNNPAVQLGEPVKMTMNFTPWVDGNSNTFANKEMIGVWTATDFYDSVVTVATDEQGDILYNDDGSVKTVETKMNQTQDPVQIAAEIGNFHYVKITDGTKLYIYVNGILGETPYILENNYLLIETFKSNAGDYFATPHIDQISPVGENGEEGSAIISVLQSESGSLDEGTYYRSSQIITYKIEAINQ